MKYIILIIIWSYTLISNATNIRVDYLIYSLDEDGTANVTGFCDDNYMSIVTIPNKISWHNTDYTVNSIGMGAFQNTNIYSISIPSSVKEIMMSAFRNCKELKNIYFHEGLESIGGYSFANCTSLENVELPNSLIDIYAYAFSRCSNLKSILLGKNLKNIRPEAFSECSKLKEIEIPDNVTILGEKVFAYCSSLEYVYLGKNIISIGKYAFAYCKNLETIELYHRTQNGYISSETFYGCNSINNINFLKDDLPKLPNNQSKEFTINGVTFYMIPVEKGTFIMGNDSIDNTLPTHKVNIEKDFYIGQTEVTQLLWNAIMTENPSTFKGDLLPVSEICWSDCLLFIKKLNDITSQNFRLPSEEEWEFAAKGGNKSHNYIYSGGNDLNKIAWWIQNSENKPHNVGTLLPNELGIYDMSGNVSEYCLINNNPTSKKIKSATLENENKVIKGGSYVSDENCIISCRSMPFSFIENIENMIHKGMLYNGFRLALDK